MKVIIELPNGKSMEVECTPLLLEQVRKRYKLEPDEEGLSEHIKRFIVVELMTAIQKQSPDA